MRVAVLGAAGLMGSAVAVDLLASPGIQEVVQLDRSRGPGIVAVDASDRQQLTLALEGADLLVNAADYRVNLAAMDAALAARAGYVDLGGLYHVTRQQLALHAAFEEAGLLAVLGCGAGPGKTNVMAAWAAESLDSVRSVRCASAGHDEAPPPGVSLPYSLRTLLDELVEPPMALRGGAPVALEPLADGGEVAFPEPVGSRGSLFTLHSEVLTLGESLGASDVDFRLSLAPRVETALRQIAQGAPAPPVAPPSARTWSAQVVEVEGERAGARVRVVATALTPPHAEWGLGGGVVSTASVAAAVVRLIGRGELQGAFGPLTGVHPPERVLRPEALFPELESRGTTFTRS